MIVKEVQAKSILSVSKIYDYVINPYTGCQHACTYCYARFMKRFSRHSEPWGEFVDAKTNAPDLLRREIARKTRGKVWVSGVCDPYQPLEETYRLARRCLEILVGNGWPVVVQTRSPLVMRDVDILKDGGDVEVGFSIPTADEKIRELFEPRAPRIRDRIEALTSLHRVGIRTYAMIAPLLPGAKGLTEALEGIIDYVLIDRMNYNHAHGVYRKHGLMEALTDDYFNRASRYLAAEFGKQGITCSVVC
jgi:DNA repair photolyase